MKPIPAHADTGRPFPTVLPSTPQRNESGSNYRRPQASAHRSYPYLLVASTLIACFFCFLYITKPVVRIEGEAKTPPSPAAPPAQIKEPDTPAKDQLAAAPSNLLPGTDSLPGDAPTAAPALPKKTQPAFEETNLTVQHVLTARVPAGDISRLVLDVPVLYQSRHLRWTQSDVEKARDLLAQLSDYQEKSLLLRSEGNRILSEWNQLITHSIPSAELRADSPSLPANQLDNTRTIVPTGLDSGKTIQLKPSGK
jgi:hypothetical protein